MTKKQTQEESNQHWKFNTFEKPLGHHESSICELGQIAKKQGPKIYEKTWN